MGNMPGDERELLTAGHAGVRPGPREPELTSEETRRLLLFGGRSHPGLVEKIGAQISIDPAPVTLRTFANGESYCRYEESVRGADVFIVQTSCKPVDRNLMELALMVNAAKLASARHVTAVIPCFPYAKQDRKAKPREPISARFVADMLEAAGVDRICTMDLHAGQIQGFFSVPVDHMTCLPLFAEHFRGLGFEGPEVISVAPDAGRAKYALRLAQILGGDFGIIHKTHPAHDFAVVTEVAGHVRDKIAIVSDDMAMTGWTLSGGVQALFENGAREVWAAITHASFAKDALDRVAESGVSGIVLTDTVPPPETDIECITVLSTAPVLAATILNVFQEGSVSAVFGGENQLI